MATIEKRSAPLSGPGAAIEQMLQQHAAAITSLGVRHLSLFGSFARGDAGPDSDVDLLVDFEPGRKTFDNFMALAFLLEDLLGRRVELVTRESLSPHLGPAILRELHDVPLGPGVPAAHP